MKNYAFDLDLTLDPLFLAFFGADLGDFEVDSLFDGLVIARADFFGCLDLMLSSHA